MDAMSIVSEALRWLSVVTLGIYAGAMLTEGGVLVPFWRSLPPAEFLRWYAANADRLLAFFSPVTTAAGVLALLAAAGSLWEGHPGRWWSVAAAVIMLAIVAGYFVYFEAANVRFATATLAPEAVPAELARWGTFHHTRSLASVVALCAALLAARHSH
jgi:hypothetical protein